MVFEVLADGEVDPVCLIREIDGHAAVLDSGDLVCGTDAGVVEEGGSVKRAGCEDDASSCVEVDDLAGSVG